MALTKEELEALAKEVGSQASTKIDTLMREAESRIKSSQEEAARGLMSTEAFEKFKSEQMAALNTQLNDIKAAQEAQGNKINQIVERKSEEPKKPIKQILEENLPKIKELHKVGIGAIEISLKEAAVITTGNALPMATPPGSPYLPGVDGGLLEYFNVVQDPNFIGNFVDIGNTNSYRLAWLNEVSGEGAAAEVGEGQPKPLMDVDFRTEISEAKKIAGMVGITEEFEQDLPQLATQVRRMIREKVMLGFNDAIYAAVIAAATGYTLTGFNAAIPFANLWDTLGAGYAQVSTSNFVPNIIGLNPITNWRILTDKDTQGRYNTPPFADLLRDKIAESNKIGLGKVLVGDLTQFKVDIYKDIVLKVGWNLDDFQRNKFSIVGEMRFHRYISDNRKKAIVYYDADAVRAQITAP